MEKVKGIIFENKKLNVFWVNRYIKFIYSCDKSNDQRIGVFEKHHILPASLFPDYKKENFNIVKLTPRQHYIAHWILAKLFGGSQWFSFNMMKRYGGKSVLYEYSRKYQKEQISISNTGRIKSEKNKQGISKRTKNTVVVKDKHGNRFRVSCDDERYISGEFVFYRTGSKHKEKTIEQMVKNNKIRGKTLFIDPNGKSIYLEKEIGVELGLASGLPETTKSKLSKTFSESCWVTEKETGKHRRIKKNDFDETVHIKGRLGFKGFEIINNRRKL